MSQYTPAITESGAPDVAKSSERTRSGDRGSAKEFQTRRVNEEAEMNAAAKEAEGMSEMEGLLQQKQQMREKDAALGQMWEQLTTTKEQLDHANTMMHTAQSSVDELTSAASQTSAGQAELQAEVEELQSFVADLEHRGSAGALTLRMQQLRQSYLHCAKQEGFHFTLAGVQAVCEHAGDSEEWQRVQVVAGNGGSKKGKAVTLQIARNRRTAALWFLAIEGQSQRIHFMKDAVDTNVEMTQVGGSGLMSAIGVSRPSRSRSKERKVQRGSYDDRM
jgi:myosin heavy subunit